MESKFSMKQHSELLPCCISDIPQKNGGSINKVCCLQTVIGLYIVMLCGYIICGDRTIFFAKMLFLPCVE